MRSPNYLISVILMTKWLLGSLCCLFHRSERLVFAVSVTDIIIEGFRRLQQFETQAISLNLALYMDGKDPRLVHDPELWPQTSNLIMFEMAKRAWALFKVYLINVFLALGRRSSWYEVAVESPKPVDDEVPISIPGEADVPLLAIDASTIEDYGNAPTPVAFVLALEELSSIAHAYSQLVVSLTRFR